jgi:hypothetical protein
VAREAIGNRCSRGWGPPTGLRGYPQSVAISYRSGPPQRIRSIIPRGLGPICHAPYQGVDAVVEGLTMNSNGVLTTLHRTSRGHPVAPAIYGLRSDEKSRASLHHRRHQASK